MTYRHKVVQGLADLIAKYGGGGRDPLMRAVWYGIKGQVPIILQALDDSEEAVKMIEDKMREALGIGPEPSAPILLDEVTYPASVPVEEIRRVVKKAPPKRKRKKPKKAAEVEVIVEPTAEE